MCQFLRKILFLVCLCLFGPWTFADEFSELQLSLVPGKPMIQRVQSEWVNGKKESARTRQLGCTFSIQVLDRVSSSGGSWVAMTCERLWCKEMGKRRVWPDYDSAESSSRPSVHLPLQGTGAMAILNQTLQVEFDPLGRVIQIDEWHGAFDAMLTSFRLSEAVSRQGAEKLKKKFCSDYLQPVVELVQIPRADHLLSLEDIWEDRKRGEMGRSDSVYTVRNITDGRVVVDIDGVLHRRNGTECPQQGHCVFDRKTGWLISMGLEQQSDGFSHSLTVVTEQVEAEGKGVMQDCIDEFLSLLEQENQFMGTVTLVQNGQSLFSRAYGFGGGIRGERIGSSRKTKYRIGSITKMFTAVMVLQMIEEGKLRLTDRLSQYFPGIDHADEITIDQLLRHQSGLGNLTAAPGYLQWSRAPRTRAEVLGEVLTLPAQFKPGIRTGYSNTNFILLGYIIEDLSGTDYAT